MTREVRLEGGQHARRLLSVGTGAHTEVLVRLANAEVLEEDRRHLRIVMLSRMDDADRDAAAVGLSQDRGDLDEVRPRSGDELDHWPVHHGAPSAMSTAITKAKLLCPSLLGSDRVHPLPRAPWVSLEDRRHPEMATAHLRASSHHGGVVRHTDHGLGEQPRHPGE
jgi:hypothetical protein